MRELKFQGYKIYSDTIEIDVFTLEQHREYEEDYWDHIVQFTGLQDKNGVDIYEGDIVKFGDNAIHEGILAKAEWISARVGFYYIFITGPNENKCTDMVDTWRTYEVIGNIHQNPELLEK